VEIELVPLVDNVVVVFKILSVVVVFGGVVIVANMIRILMLGTVGSSQSFSLDAFIYVLVCLRFMRLVVFCVF